MVLSYGFQLWSLGMVFSYGFSYGFQLWFLVMVLLAMVFSYGF